MGLDTSRLRKCLILALDSRTPEMEAMAAMRVVRQMIPSGKVHEHIEALENGKGSSDYPGGNKWSVSLTHIRVNSYHMLSSASYSMAERLNLSEFQFRLLSDPLNPNSSFFATVEFRYRCSPQVHEIVGKVVDEWIKVMNDANKPKTEHEDKAQTSKNKSFFNSWFDT